MNKSIVIFISIVTIIIASCSTAKMPKTNNDLLLLPYDITTLTYGPEENQVFEYSLPTDLNNSVNAIFYIHGINGGTVEHWTFFNNYRNDFIVASMNYPMPFGNSETIMDKAEDIAEFERQFTNMLTNVTDAITAFKDEMDAKGISIKNFILIGHSMGGGLALLYSYKIDPKPLPATFCVALAPLTSFEQTVDFTHQINENRKIPFPLRQILGIGNSAFRKTYRFSYKTLSDIGPLEVFKEMSAVNYVHEEAPPTIIVHDKNDKINPYSHAEALTGLLSKNHVPHIFIPSNNLGHLLGANGNESNLRMDVNLEKELILAIDEYIKLYFK